MAAQSESMSDQRAILVRHEAEPMEHAHPHHRDRGLLAIGLFKLGKAALFFGLGVGAIHLLHKDLADEVLRLAAALKFDQESRFVNLILEKVDLIDSLLKLWFELAVGQKMSRSIAFKLLRH